MGECRYVMEVENWKGFVFLAEGFYALRAPSRVEITFLDAVSRSKANESGAEKGSGEPYTKQEHKPARQVPEQVRSFFVVDGFGHSSQRR